MRENSEKVVSVSSATRAKDDSKVAVAGRVSGTTVRGDNADRIKNAMIRCKISKIILKTIVADRWFWCIVKKPSPFICCL